MHSDMNPNDIALTAVAENRLNPYLQTVRDSPEASSSRSTPEPLTVATDGITIPETQPARPAAKPAKNLNMHGVFLHVLGDALGSIAVMISATIIWLSTWEHRFIFDPLISLIITAIILTSTIPLVRKASIILLQGTPRHLNMRDIRKELISLPGVADIHELHIWQLSDTKIIASVHVVCEVQSDFMDLANEIKRTLHAHGIHSVTVQPEFKKPLSATEDAQSLQSEKSADTAGCLLRCNDDVCGSAAECCPPDVVMEWTRESTSITVVTSNSTAVVDRSLGQRRTHQNEQ